MATDYDAPRKTEDDSESIEALKERVPDKLSGSVDVDDSDNPSGFELPGADLSDLELDVVVLPPQEDEFTCIECFLVKHRTQIDHETAIGPVGPVGAACASVGGAPPRERRVDARGRARREHPLGHRVAIVVDGNPHDPVDAAAQQVPGVAAQTGTAGRARLVAREGLGRAEVLHPDVSPSDAQLSALDGDDGRREHQQGQQQKRGRHPQRDGESAVHGRDHDGDHRTGEGGAEQQPQRRAQPFTVRDGVRSQIGIGVVH